LRPGRGKFKERGGFRKGGKSYESRGEKKPNEGLAKIKEGKGGTSRCREKGEEEREERRVLKESGNKKDKITLEWGRKTGKI